MYEGISEQNQAAAQHVLDHGWWVFAMPFGGKAPFRDSHGFKDARNDVTALLPWSEGELRNPAIDLERSNLTVLDIDSGIHDVEHAMRFLKLLGVATTFIVQSARGFHFYFSGLIEKNAKYVNGNISGDLKCHGYVLAEGALHSSGKPYVCISDVPPAPLPKCLLEYKADKKKREPRAPKQSTEPTETVVYPQRVYTEPTYTTEKVRAGRRYLTLQREAAYLRKRGADYAYILAAITGFCIGRCEDGAAYATPGKMEGIARYACNIPIGKIRIPASPKPELPLRTWLREHLPVTQPVALHTLKMADGWKGDTHDKAHRIARKSLFIISYKIGVTQFWERCSSSLDTIKRLSEVQTVSAEPVLSSTQPLEPMPRTGRVGNKVGNKIQETKKRTRSEAYRIHAREHMAALRAAAKGVK
jgi:hypothetical protein